MAIFADLNETTGTTVPTGTISQLITVTVNVPVNAVVGASLGERVRLSTDAVAQQPIGLASNGEVEDYVIQVNCPLITVNVPPSTICAGQSTTLTASASGGNSPYTMYGLLVL